VTYNLQESQDFFEASLDGRLSKYHQIEKELIEAQLGILKKFPAEDPRRLHVETELKADLEFVSGNMADNPKVRSHRERMQCMHQDFFSLLKWQRKKIQTILEKEPEILIDGDIEKLLQDLEEMRKKAVEKENFLSKYGESEKKTKEETETADKKNDLVIKNLYENNHLAWIT